MVGEPELACMEFGLYSDASFGGELSGPGVEGPVQLFNGFNNAAFGPRASIEQPVLFLRVTGHVDTRPTTFEGTSLGYYHGGDIQDEFAALLSLCLGIRLKAGGPLREYHSPNTRGRPRADMRRPLLDQTSRSGPRLLPSFQRQCLLTTDLFEMYFAISPLDAVALVRAARLYQEAVWIAESSPHLSWIMMVSALEAAAGQWSQAITEDADLLERKRPQLVSDLREACGEDAVSIVARHLAPELGATMKFINFVMTFLPDPPLSRPYDWLQVDWKPSAMKRTLSQVYSCRSRALHGGIPFPAGMCDPPFQFSADQPFSERPLGLSQTAQGGTWQQSDQPMLLHLFEYVTRNAILGWWRSVIPDRFSLPNPK